MNDPESHPLFGHRVEYFQNGPEAPTHTNMHILEIRSGNPNMPLCSQDGLLDDSVVKFQPGQ